MQNDRQNRNLSLVSRALGSVGQLPRSYGGFLQWQGRQQRLHLQVGAGTAKVILRRLSEHRCQVHQIAAAKLVYEYRTQQPFGGVVPVRDLCCSHTRVPKGTRTGQLSFDGRCRSWGGTFSSLFHFYSKCSIQHTLHLFSDGLGRGNDSREMGYPKTRGDP